MPKMNDDEFDDGFNDDDVDAEPIPARRDTRIFQIKTDKKEKEEDDEFDEDVFV